MLPTVNDCSAEFGRLMNYAFRCVCTGAVEELPSRRDYPDYYEVISRPIDIQTIASRVEDSAHQGHYASYDAFSADMLRIFVNARECQQSRLI